MENIILIGTVLLVHLLAVASPGPDFVVAVRKNSWSVIQFKYMKLLKIIFNEKDR